METLFPANLLACTHLLFVCLCLQSVSDYWINPNLHIWT